MSKKGDIYSGLGKHVETGNVGDELTNDDDAQGSTGDSKE